jgi:hypothetical protein
VVESQRVRDLCQQDEGKRDTLNHMIHAKLLPVLHGVKDAGDALFAQGLPYEQHIGWIIFCKKDVRHRNIDIYFFTSLVMRLHIVLLMPVLRGAEVSLLKTADRKGVVSFSNA